MKHLTINIFCMIRELDGLMNFSLYPVCLALISFTPALKRSEIRASTNLHSA